MRLPLTCMKCNFEKDGAATRTPAYPVYVEVRDDGRYEFTCSNGHTTVTVVQEQKFEVLFEIGAYALLDGYYREAVASFASSLERFYEFFVKANLLEEGCKSEQLEEAWKMISSQSERQLGAFIFLYLQTFGKRPSLLDNAKVSFRNDVIHKGKIPNRDGALEFGQAVLDVVRPIMEQTKERFPNGVQQMVLEHLMKSRKTDEAGPVSTMSIATIVSLNSGESKHKTQSLREALSAVSWWRTHWR